MGRKEVLAERKALEEYYYNCKLETPEEVAKLFEVYTKLIWIRSWDGAMRCVASVLFSEFLHAAFWHPTVSGPAATAYISP